MLRGRYVAVALLVAGCSLDAAGLLPPSGRDAGTVDSALDGSQPADARRDGGPVDGGPADSRGVSDGGDAGPRDVGACDADLATDPMSCGACGHDCGGGACAAGTCAPYDLVVAAPTDTIRAVAIDSAHLYWSNTTANTVVQANLDGTSPHAFLSGVSADEIAVDATALYYTSGGLHRVPFGAPIDTEITPGPDGCIWIESPTLVYTTEFTMNEVVSVNLDAGSITILLGSSDGVFQPWGVASTAVEFYWTSSGPAVDGSIAGHPLPSGANATLRSGLANPNCLSFDEAGRLYWPNYGDGTIHRSNADGTSETTLASGQIMPTTVAINATYLYWNSGNNVVRLAR
jgi:hypothetical protein